MHEMDEVFIFDHQATDPRVPARGIIHEVHAATDRTPLAASGSMLLRHDAMVESRQAFRPFLKMPVVDHFTVTDPTMTKWPHLGKFVAKSYSNGGAA